jgi:ABC 3 transport family
LCLSAACWLQPPSLSPLRYLTHPWRSPFRLGFWRLWVRHSYLFGIGGTGEETRTCRRAAGFLYLIVPSVGAMLYAERIGPRLAIGWTMGTVVSALGVYLSLKIDLPTGAAIVCTFGIVLILMALFRGVIRRRVA